MSGSCRARRCAAWTPWCRWGEPWDCRFETADELAEGSHVADAFELLRSLAAAEGDSVLCSHGDVIPGLLWVLAQCGLDIPELGRCKKGSIWELQVSDGRVVGASYRHPRTFGAA